MTKLKDEALVNESPSIPNIRLPDESVGAAMLWSPILFTVNGRGSGGHVELLEGAPHEGIELRRGRQGGRPVPPEQEDDPDPDVQEQEADLKDAPVRHA